MKRKALENVTLTLQIITMIAAGALVANCHASPPLIYDVKLDHVWIPMKDGVRLATWLYTPVAAPANEKFPAILKLAPYRNDDSTGNISDCEVVKYWVSRGYVGACVDIRGTGRSEGHTPPREYSQQELNDGEQVIAWLASQSWSNGSVGAYGISWTGFNGLRLAMRHPPALKAVISADSTEVLYNEDCHYTDGISTIVDEYNTGIDSMNGRSPSPDFPIDEKTLENRFDNTPWTLVWMQHQRDSAFWHESQEPLDSVQVPVFLIGGFLDTYRDTIPRWISKVHAPIRAIVGPWNHTFPDEANPGPGIEWKDLALRWWDQWLKGKDTGVMLEPKLAVYMRHWFPPDPNINDNPGEWRAEKGWPPQDQKVENLYLRSDHSLNESTSGEAAHKLKYVPSIGAEAGEVWGEISPDQRPVDAYSLVYDSAPLEKDTAILGLPEVRLRASADAPQADWFVRLNDVAPDGQVTQITGGGLNGAQRDSMIDPQDLEPSKIYSLRVPMRFTSWVFPVGHRIRVSISNAQWPMFWPTPYSMTTSLYLGGEDPSRLLLPTVPVAGRPPSPNFKPLPPIAKATSVSPTWTLQRSMSGKPIIIETGNKEYKSKPTSWQWGTYNGFGFRRLEVPDEHPELASYTGHNEFKVKLSERELHWHTDWDIHSDRMNFYYRFRRELEENGKVIREKEWKETIPRDHQ